MTDLNPTYLAHRIEQPTTTTGHHHAPSTVYWYPLHHLTRWSGAVELTAPVTLVKLAMGEAKQAIDQRCHQQARQLEEMYKKIGTVICVNEEGFETSVRTWTQTRPNNAALQQFAQQLTQICQQVFHSHTQPTTHSAVAPPPINLPSLIQKYSFDITHAPVGTVRSASLAAPKDQFSLAAFLDQHLQPTGSLDAKRKPSPPSNTTDSTTHLRTDLQHLETALKSQLQTTSETHPQIIAQEMERVQSYQTQLEHLTSQHATIQQRLQAHIDHSKPMHNKVTTLQRNMAFIQHVQLYEQLLRQVTELSDRCRDDTISGHLDPKHPSATPHSSHGPSASSFDVGNLQNICVMFLKLLRLYQGLQQSTQAHLNSATIEEKDDSKQSDSDSSTSWTGVVHLQRMVRQRILTILQPLKGKLVQLYQQTLVALNWPQTTTTLLLGMHSAPIESSHSRSSKTGVTSGASSTDTLDSNLKLFEVLSENLIRIQMLLHECGLFDEIKSIEREIGTAKQAERKTKEVDRTHFSRCWVLTLLLQPIYKRFYYHFDSVNIDAPTLSSASTSGVVDGNSGSLTNRLDKPEWVCTFLEKVFKDHQDFLEKMIQPIINTCGWTKKYEELDSNSNNIDSVNYTEKYEFSMEFLERLLGFYNVKLTRPSVLSAILSDPALLRHTLQELISFESKLEAVYSYPIQSSRRLSLLEPFLLGEPFQVLLKTEQDAVNQGLDELRNLKRPWESVNQHGGGGGSRSHGLGEDESDDEEASQMDQDIIPVATAVTGESEDTSTLLSHSSSATNSSHSFLLLISRLTSRYRSFKYLNLRLLILKEIQFKLFEIYEEDLIRAFQQNWKELTDNLKRGGAKKLVWDRRMRKLSTSERNNNPTSTTSNPLPLWQTHCGILNSIAYILTILKDWNDEFIFLELFYFYTHKTKIQSSLLQAHQLQLQQQGDKLIHTATPIGGVLVHHGDEDEIYLTSEELARWMANGGSATLTQPQPTSNTAKATTKPPTASHGRTPSTVDAAISAFLPVEFQESVDKLVTLSQLSNNHASSSPEPISSNSPPASTAPIPLDLSISGTLFDPILASYNSLQEEMIHSLVNVVVNHFRDGIRHEYTQQGHMTQTHTAHAAAFQHPALTHFFKHDATTPSTATERDWELLDSHLDISPSLCPIILDLKMQLIVVYHSLTKSLHRSFWSSVASKLSQILFDDLVVGQYFTRSGSLQFMRDMRAIFILFHIYAPPAINPNGPNLNSHFKLIQDTINILLLSPSQLEELQLQLTTGAAASSSVSHVRAFLARPPYYIQKLSSSQVMDIITHMRTQVEDQQLETHTESPLHDESNEPSLEDDLDEDFVGEPTEERVDLDENGNEYIIDDEHFEAQEEPTGEFDAAQLDDASDSAPLEYEPTEEQPHPDYQDNQVDEEEEYQPNVQPLSSDATEDDSAEPEFNIDDLQGFPEPPEEETSAHQGVAP